MFSKNRNKIKLNHILLAVLPGLIVAGFWGFANSSPRTIFDELRLSESVMVIDANDTQKRTRIVASPLWQCGDDITFNYRRVDITYGTVEKDYGGGNVKCWMDRNLGATKVAEAYNDCVSYPSDCSYGDLFQWGRLDDDHQNRTSNTTSTLSTADNPGHNNFILAPDSPYDWRSGQNINLWQGDGGINDPCPPGWRIPTETELENERLSWSSNDYNGAIASPLKLPAGGGRSHSYGSLHDVDAYGHYWSSTVDGIRARHLRFYSTHAHMNSNYRALGFSVRCLKD